MNDSVFIGYPANVWATCYQSLSWLSNILADGATNISAIDDPTESVFTTLVNAINAIDAWQAGAVLTLEGQNLLAVQALPLGLDSLTQSYFSTRIASITTAAAQITALQVSANPFNAISLLSQGKPAVADPGFIEWGMKFAGEQAPIGASLPSGADTMAQSWLNVTNAVGVLQGSNLTTAYDTAARQYRCCALIANQMNDLMSGGFSQENFTGGAVQATDSAGNPLFDTQGNPMYTSGFVPSSTLWNQALALPTILLDAAALSSSPATLGAQQSAVIRNILIGQIQQLALLLLSLRIHNVTQPTTATLRNFESLADLAARTTGNFEDWTAIAALNHIKPPYPGPANQAVALSGKQLFTSNSTSTPGILPDPDASGVTYAANVLGTDWWWGGLNQPQPAWTGDISIITGLYNFALSIGRRLQTPLGDLIYHTNYGSRIPPEVGAVQSADEASRLNQYGRSAILADPRTGNIQSSSATTQPGFLATFEATVVPIGFSANAVSVNETIGATP